MKTQKRDSIFSLQSKETQLNVLEKYYIDTRSDIQDIKFHMDVLNNETGELRDVVKQIRDDIRIGNGCTARNENSIIQLQTDMDWLKKAFWIVASSSVGAVIVGLINLLEKR